MKMDLNWFISGARRAGEQSAFFVGIALGEHRLLYGRPEDQLPAAVLSPVADGLLLTEWNPDSGKYSRIKLVPCALRRGTPEQSLADARLGEPRIWAETSEGDFCYCTEEEAALRRSLVEHPTETVPEDLVYRPEDSETGGEESAFAGFTYIANDADTPETETETAGTEPEKTIAEEPSLELPASESPAAAQEGDYAADHELFPRARTLQNRPSGVRPARRLWTFRSPPGKKRSFRFLR